MPVVSVRVMTQNQDKPGFASAQTLVVKVGSAVLTNEAGDIDREVITDLCDQIAEQVRAGRSVILVTSGAVAAGRSGLELHTKKPTVSEKQALAAVGQTRLMQLYAELFGKHSIVIGQMLLTRGDMEDRRRYVNARYTLEELLKRRCVPIINENDTVTVDELRFGDNDGLAAVVAGKMEADGLILLSDVDGLFDCNPATHKNAQLIQTVERLTPERIDELCPSAGIGSAVGSGGMRSKLNAAMLATQSGVPTVIASGKVTGQVRKILHGDFRGTVFPAAPHRRSSREHWILSGKSANGRGVEVDDGARAALTEKKKSLLTAGIRAISGSFAQGDVIEIRDGAGHVIGRGVVNYSSEELARIKGRKSSEIAEILGEKPYDEAIHRDNLVLADNL